MTPGDWSRHDFYVQVHTDGTGLIGWHGCDPALGGACDIESRVQVTIGGAKLKLTVARTYVINGDAPHRPVPTMYWSEYSPRPWGKVGDYAVLTSDSTAGLVRIQSFYSDGHAVSPAQEVLCGSDPAGRAQAKTGICGA